MKSTDERRAVPPEIKARNPRRRKESKKWPGAAGWTRRVFTLYGSTCVICGHRARQGHHAVPRQVILSARHLSPEERRQYAYDARNGVPVCPPCHAAHEGGSRRIRFPDLPLGVIEWGEAHGFGWYLAKTAIYPRERAA